MSENKNTIDTILYTRGLTAPTEEEVDCVDPEKEAAKAAIEKNKLEVLVKPPPSGCVVQETNQ